MKIVNGILFLMINAPADAGPWSIIRAEIMVRKLL